MHLLIWLCLGGLLGSAAASDIQLVLDQYPAMTDEAKWKAIFDCCMGRRPCGNYEAAKDASVRIYLNKCQKCTAQQKEKFESLLNGLIKKYPNQMAEIINKLAA